MHRRTGKTQEMGAGAAGRVQRQELMNMIESANDNRSPVNSPG